MRNFGNFRNQSIVEPMEPRRLLSSGFPNVNISRMAGSQAEGAIAVDPVNPKLLFAAGNVDVGDGLTATTSSDGGVTWSIGKLQPMAAICRRPAAIRAPLLIPSAICS